MQYGCHGMVYCSRACQKEDWLNGGHKLACCKSFTYDLAGQFQGRCVPLTEPENERAATKMKELETNLNMIQLRLFVDNSETILSQAKALGLPLYDCILKHIKHQNRKRCSKILDQRSISLVLILHLSTMDMKHRKF